MQAGGEALSRRRRHTASGGTTRRRERGRTSPRCPSRSTTSRASRRRQDLLRRRPPRLARAARELRVRVRHDHGQLLARRADATRSRGGRRRRPRREDLLRGRPERRRGGSVVRRLRPGSGHVGAAAGHAARAGPLPGRGRRRQALRDRRPARPLWAASCRDRRATTSPPTRGRRNLALLPTPRGGSPRRRSAGDLRHRRRDADGALRTVEAYDARTDTLANVDPMPTARHGIQAAVYDDGIFVAAGGATAGGADPVAAFESSRPVAAPWARLRKSRARGTHQLSCATPAHEGDVAPVRP